MKQTEIGLIPDDWEVKRLNAICNNISSGKNQNRFVNGIYPVYGSTGIIGFCNNNKYSGDAILVARVGANAGLVNKVAGKYDVSDNTLVIQSDKCDIDYLSRLLAFRNLNQLIFGSGQPLITGGQLKALLIQLPSLTEQQRIAKALFDVDALISTTEKLIQKKKNIKQGTMQKLLTGKKRLPGFAKSNNTKMTELGEIPEDWEVKSLGEIAETFTGLTYSPENVYEHGTLVLRSSNIKNEQLCFEDNVFVQMPIPERAFVKENDILICVRNGSKALIGKSALIPKSAVGMAFGAFMTVLRSTSVNQNYLLYVWQSDFVQNQVTDNLGATINQITNADFKKFNVILSPNRQEQTAIANVLSSMDKEIETLNTKLEKYRNLKTAMMQQLLTGKIRLR